MRRGYREALPSFAVLALLGCGGVRVREQKVALELAWPPGQPRVRLERVIQQRSTSAPLVSWLSGSGSAPVFARPHGIAWDGSDLIVADPGARTVLRITSAGKVVSSPEGAAGAALGVAVCPAGIVASDSEGGRVAILGPDLRRLRWLTEGLSRPTGLACSGDTVFVAETGAHRVLALGTDGTRRIIGERGEGPGRFNFPTVLALASGFLLVGDTLNFRVQRLDPASGSFVDSFGQLGDAAGEMPRLKGVAADSAGNVWVSDAYLDQVSLYDRNGSLLLTLGGPGPEPGRFSFPAGIAANPDGRMAVVDVLNRRVQVFRLIDQDRKP